MIHYLFFEIIATLIVGASAFTVLYAEYAKGKQPLHLDALHFDAAYLLVILFAFRKYCARLRAVPEPLPEAVPMSGALPVAGAVAGNVARAVSDELPRGRLSATYGVSEREFEILELVVQGKTNAQIAELLFLSPHTVKNHLYNAYKKLGVANRMELVKKLTE